MCFVVMKNNDPNQFRFVEESNDDIRLLMKDIKKRYKISLDKKNKEQEGEALSYISLLYYKLGEYDKALDYNQQHLSLSETTNNLRGKRRSHCNLGCIYKVMGDLPMALFHLKKAYNISKEQDEKKALARICNNIANIYAMLMDLDKCIEYQNERLSLSTTLEDFHGQSKACANLAEIHLVNKDFDQSLYCYEKLLEVLRAKLRKLLNKSIICCRQFNRSVINKIDTQLILLTRH